MLDWLAKRHEIGIGCVLLEAPIPLIKLLSDRQRTQRAQAQKPKPRPVADLFERVGNNHHFSELLLDDEDFKAIAKVSIYGPVEDSFAKLFTLPDEHHEKQFDSFCQLVNRRLAKNFDNMINNTGRTQKGMHRRTLEFLQSSVFTNLINKLFPSLQNRLCLGAVVLTLERHMLERIDKFRKSALQNQSDHTLPGHKISH